MMSLDMNSQEFKDELENTIKFTDKVVKQFNWEYSPNSEVVEGVQMGLARHKLLYGKRFCPCFLVEETEDGKFKSSDNRICPCKPAINEEIPNNGICHCQIFCTPQKAKELKEEMNK